MPERRIVDTNVPIAANGHADRASVACITECSRRLRQLMQFGILVLDDQWLILGEYMKNLRSQGQPGIGDAFLRWVLTNQMNPSRCEQVSISTGSGGFPVVPDSLLDFDPSDKKFVALSLAHPDQPAILNATDTDWWHFRDELAAAGVVVEFLCPALMSETRKFNG